MNTKELLGFGIGSAITAVVVWQLYKKSGGKIVWECPVAEGVIAPSPENGRPELDRVYTLYPVSELSSDVEWFSILWMDGSTGGWLVYDSRMTIGNTLFQVEPGKVYYVIISEPGQIVFGNDNEGIDSSCKTAFRG